MMLTVRWMGMRFETRQRQASRLAQPPEVLCLDDCLATAVLCFVNLERSYCCVLCTLPVGRISSIGVVLYPVVVFSTVLSLRARRMFCCFRCLECKQNSSTTEVLLVG